MQFIFGKIVMCLNPRHFSILLLERTIFKRNLYKQITCISEQCEKEIIQHYKIYANNIEVIYNGVDTHTFTPSKQNDVQRRCKGAKYAVASNEVILLFDGLGFKRKGLKHVVDALKC